MRRKSPHVLIRIANYNTLTVSRATENGLYLIDPEGDEVLLPNRYVSPDMQPGSKVNVFVYSDSEDRPVATTDDPLIVEGGIAALEVVGFNFHGSFLNWGLPKDLFIPKSNQRDPMRPGERHVVQLYVDQKTNRPVATAKLHKFISNEQITVRPREEVELLVTQRIPMGFRAIVNNRHWGVLYDNQLFVPVAVGDRLKGYVVKITDEGRIDVSLQQSGFDQVKVAADQLLAMIEQADGTLPLGDLSAPDQVRLATGMSKKVFKRAIGLLMSQGLVIVGDNETQRIKSEKK